METTANGWKVLDRAAGVLIYEYSFAKQGYANTFVARMANDKLLVVSPATRITDAALDDLREFGEVGAVIAPNGFHHLGVAEWRTKFPSARFFAAPETVLRVRQKNPGAGAFEPCCKAQWAPPAGSRGQQTRPGPTESPPLGGLRDRQQGVFYQGWPDAVSEYPG
jgi:hypothetical protein